MRTRRLWSQDQCPKWQQNWFRKDAMGAIATHSYRAAVYRMWRLKLGAHYDLEIFYHCCILQSDFILSDPWLAFLLVGDCGHGEICIHLFQALLHPIQFPVKKVSQEKNWLSLVELWAIVHSWTSQDRPWWWGVINWPAWLLCPSSGRKPWLATLMEVHGWRGGRRRVDFSEAGLGDEKD